jgi:cytochrome c biogenesis protein CcdA
VVAPRGSRGATDTQLPAVSTRTLQAILAGLTVTAGAVAIVAVVGVPIALGAGQITAAVPWVGFALGVIMALVAVITLAGKKIPLPDRGIRLDGHRRGIGTLLMFGAGYGVASLSCTLPIFLVVIGASLTTHGGLAALTVFAGYALGMAVVLTALAIGAALLRDGVTRALARLLPHLRWVTGGLLLAVSAYLLYFWGTALFAPASTRAHDPVITLTEQLTNHVQQWATTIGGPCCYSLPPASSLSPYSAHCGAGPAPTHHPRRERSSDHCGDDRGGRCPGVALRLSAHRVMRPPRGPR